MNGRSRRLAIVLGAGGLLLLLFLLGLRGGGEAMAADGIAPAPSPRQQEADHLVINEFAPKGTEWIELYNPLTVSINLDGWYLTDGEGTDPLGSVVITPGGYLVTPTANINLNNDGDEVMLYAPGDILVDAVAFGIKGPAPIAPTGDSVARAPNGHDSDDDAADWTLDASPTRGTENDAPAPALGSSIVLNEINSYVPPADDAVELYNPLSVPVTITNWQISDGDGWGTITTTEVVIPPGGLFVFDPNDIGVYFASRDVFYLFTDAGVRVDQIGWYSEYEDQTFQRIPDGVGPNDGYTWATSGAPCHWRDLPSTLGSTNAFTPDLIITKTGASMARPGDLITFTLSYLNGSSGGDDAMPVITDLLPANLSYVTDTSGLPCPACVSGATGTLTWSLGTLPLCKGGAFELVVAVDDRAPYGAVLTNTAAIFSGTVDLDPADNVATQAVTIAPNVSVAKDGLRYAIIGKEIVYTLTVTNEGVAPVGDVTLVDELPPQVNFSGALPVPTTVSGQSLIWDIGTMAAGQVLTYHVLGVVDSATAPGAVLTNSARITVTATGEITGDNEAIFTTTAYPLVSIHDVQFVADAAITDASPYAGEPVWVTGTVVAGTGEIGPAHESYFIGEPNGGPWSGLLIFNRGAFTDVVEGDAVLLLGTVEEVEGMTRLDLSHPPAVQKVTGRGKPLPPPSPISTTTYSEADITQAEPYESVLVRCEEAALQRIGSGTVVTWTLDDGSGAATASDAGKFDGDLSYAPTDGDYFFRLVALANAGRTLTPRYDDDLQVGRRVTFVYHDAEDVVRPGERVYLAGSFNGWLPTALRMEGDDDLFTATVGLTLSTSYEYKYVVYTATGAAPQWDWLNTANRTITVTADLTRTDDYRNVVVGWGNLEGPAAQTVNIGESSDPITGQLYVQGVTPGAGAGRGLKAEVGYGQSDDPAAWSWSPMGYVGEVGNNDRYGGVVTPTANGVYSYAVRYDGNWGAGNPHAGWTYADLDGTPFTVDQAGVLTVTAPLVVLTKTVVPTALLSTADLFTYTLTAYNAGDGAADGAVITDVLPGGVRFGGWVEQPDGAVEAGGAITWTGTISPAASVRLVFTATLDGPHFGETITNTAFFSATYAEPLEAEAAFTVLTPALTLSKSVAPARVRDTHRPLTFTLTAGNGGPAWAEGAVLTDALPDGLRFGGWVLQPDGAVEVGGTITWTGTISPQGTVALVFTATLDGPHFGETLTNTARLSAFGATAALTEAAFSVLSPTIALAKNVEPAALPSMDAVITYTIAANNDGLAWARDALLTDTLPAGVRFGGWVIQPGGAVEAGGTITWTGALAPADTLGLVFTATLDGLHFDEIITNTAFFSAEGVLLAEGRAAFATPSAHTVYLPLVMRNH